jgi:hypothetical protein
MIEVGRWFLNNCSSTSAIERPPKRAAERGSSESSVGPGRMLLTVTPVRAQPSAMPRATAICAALLIPYCTLSTGICSALSLEMKMMRPQLRCFMRGR